MKKGFTLIELLAVIVILAIIALIAVPIVINIINDAKGESDKRSIELYAKSFEKVIAIDNDNGKYKLLNYYKAKVEKSYKGNRVQCDFNPDSNEDEHSSTLINGKLTLRGCIVGENKEFTYVYDGNVKLEIYDEYKVGDEVTINNEQYYVIKDSSKKEKYVTALKKYPLTVDEVNLYGGSGTENNHINKYTRQSRGEAYNLNGYGGIAYYSSEHCGWYSTEAGAVDKTQCEVENATSYDTSDIKYVVDNWSNQKFLGTDLIEIDEYKARLVTVEELQDNLGLPQYYTNYSKYTWIHDYKSWTMTKGYRLDEVIMLGIDYWLEHGVYTGYYPGDSGTVRPVINVYKDKIQKE